MPSSVIRRFEYAPAARELHVEFVTGRRYIYADVPPDAAAALRSAFAKGVHFNRHIRDRYPCRELRSDGGNPTANSSFVTPEQQLQQGE